MKNLLRDLTEFKYVVSFSQRVTPRTPSQGLPRDISSRNNEFLIMHF